MTKPYDDVTAQRQQTTKKNKRAFVLFGMMIIAVIMIQIILPTTSPRRPTMRLTSSAEGTGDVKIKKLPTWKAEYRIDENKDAILQKTRTDFAEELLAQLGTNAMYDYTVAGGSTEQW